MDRWDWTRVLGPLAPYAAGYERWLLARGFASLSLPRRMWQFDHLSRWLEREALSADQLTPGRAQEFLVARRNAGYVTWVSGLSLRLPLGYLREVGAIPSGSPVLTDRRVDRLLEDYRVYLARERGLDRGGDPQVRERCSLVFGGQGTDRRAGLGAPDCGRCQRVSRPGVPAAECLGSADAGGQAPRPVALSARRGVDPDSVAVGGSRGRGSSRPLAGAWARAGGRTQFGGQLRSSEGHGSS
jgi:hypothetical protein